MPPTPTIPGTTAAKGSAGLEDLYRRHRDAIRRYIQRVFGSGPPDPDDVVQIAFEKYAALTGEPPIDNPEAFLRASARNYVLDQRRRQAVRASHAREVTSLDEDRDDFDAARVLEAKERWRTIEAAILQLDERKQEMLIMNRIHGLSSAEIARRKGCSATLVKAEIAKALVACERALRREEEA